MAEGFPLFLFSLLSLLLRKYRMTPLFGYHVFQAPDLYLSIQFHGLCFTVDNKLQC